MWIKAFDNLNSDITKKNAWTLSTTHTDLLQNDFTISDDDVNYFSSWPKSRTLTKTQTTNQLQRHHSTASVVSISAMAISKNTPKQNNMLFMLASLACNGQNKARDSIPAAVAVSDASDDDRSVTALPQVKEVVVARRRRRPIKKRIPGNDYQCSPLNSPPGSSLAIPKKSLLESSIKILRCPRKIESISLTTYNKKKAASVHNQRQKKTSCCIRTSVGSGTLPLAHDDEKWKQVHSPLDLPSFLPCPAIALRNVESISLNLGWESQPSIGWHASFYFVHYTHNHTMEPILIGFITTDGWRRAVVNHQYHT